MAKTTGHFENSYTFAISGLPAAHQDLAGVIERDATAAINYLSEYISWKGSLDFVVKFAGPNDFGGTGRGLLPSYGGIAADGRTNAGSEALTGKDANGSDWDAGCYILPNANGSLTNYDRPLYFDPAPNPDSAPAMPSGSHDFYSIYIHEVMHALGIWSSAQNGGPTSAFDKLTTERGGQYFFTGANTNALLGEDLPLAAPNRGSRDHYGTDASAGPGGSPIDRGLMWEFGNYELNRLQLGKVDLAILKDLGYTVANADRLAVTEQPDTGGGSNAGDDNFVGTDVSETFDGQAGIDRVIYNGPRERYMVDLKANSVIEVSRDAGDVDTLSSIERISFSDGAFVYDIDSQNAKTAYLLYGGAFDRTPDEAGLKYWIGQLDNGVGLLSVSGGFINSTEFVARYGSDLSDAQFIAALYLNVLHRPGETAGVKYWNDFLANGEGDRDRVLVGFTQEPEFVANTAKDIDNGFWVIQPIV